MRENIKHEHLQWLRDVRILCKHILWIKLRFDRPDISDPNRPMPASSTGCDAGGGSVADDGGVFKSRTRRAETRDAAEIRDSQFTATDLPLDYVRAEQVDVRIHSHHKLCLCVIRRALFRQ